MSHLRRSLSAPLANGHTAFVLPCKKLVFEYCEHWASNAGLREYLVQDLRRLASRYPGVELVVRRREFKHPVVRAVYVNGRDKVICLRSLLPPSVSSKVQLLLDSSGQKITNLKRPKVESTTESVRGIWSAFHEEKRI